MPVTLSGGCLCGAIRFTAQRPTPAHTCSCAICQKHTGGQTLTWVEFAAEDVRWTGEGGAPATYRSSEASCRAFCPRCGSSLGAIDDEPRIALLTGVIDQPGAADLQPVSHSFTDGKPDWWRKLCS